MFKSPFCSSRRILVCSRNSRITIHSTTEEHSSTNGNCTFFDPEKMPLEAAIDATESRSQSHQIPSDHFAILLRRCAVSKSLHLGQRLHRQIVEKNMFQNRFLCNLLINLYTKCGCLQSAESVFESISNRNLHSWTMMLSAYAQNGHFSQTLSFFRQMQNEGMTPSEVGISLFISACTNSGSVSEGRGIQNAVSGTGVETEHIVQTALVTMYGKLGYPKEAEVVFRTMDTRDVVAWSAMIAASARNGYPGEALELFRRMDLEGIPPNNVTFVSGLDACASLAALKQGRHMHERVVALGMQHGVVIGTALLNLYGKCGRVDTAREVFDGIPEKNVVTWSALSAAYAQNGYCREAIHVFHRMDLEGIPPNSMTFVSVLDACAGSAALRQGKKIHSRIQSVGYELESDVFVLTALVNMYSKCGSLESANALFKRTQSLDRILWNSLIAMNAQNGENEKALVFFREMQLEGYAPTNITFTSVLFACSHAGVVERGRTHFLSFIGDHGVTPEGEHFGCMIDLLARSGHLSEAEDLLENMPYEPHTVSWMSFLGACRTYRDMPRATVAAENLFRLDPQKRAPYVLLSNMYAKAGRWSEVAKLRKRMKAASVVKEAGRSWIEIKDHVHEFVSGDLEHPRITEIHARLNALTEMLKETGYVPDTDMVLHDVKAGEKENMVGSHSEKLAMGLALIATPEGTPIRVVKNLRVCNDCHTATKFISKAVGREIVVRDCNRFHRFVDGVCSCGDYW